MANIGSLRAPVPVGGDDRARKGAEARKKLAAEGKLKNSPRIILRRLNNQLFKNFHGATNGAVAVVADKDIAINADFVRDFFQGQGREISGMEARLNALYIKAIHGCIKSNELLFKIEGYWQKLEKDLEREEKDEFGHQLMKMAEIRATKADGAEEKIDFNIGKDVKIIENLAQESELIDD